ncbi:MAG TPA: CRISPR system precrRNA processing endoribonuclease RAMP protein Cas6 [Anaerolineales bacterium]|nr:CRISPR system precrRNA processing endoribonuclease RAMP protein Cas6 [Anaerolineales bacterium]
MTTTPFPLTVLPLRFDCRATQPLYLGGERAGSNLRGALTNVMSRAVCYGERTDPQHVKTCPVCWLLAANEHPGTERRGYSLVLPESAYRQLQPGDKFSFGVTLFGTEQRFVPYFLIAIPETGRQGVGPGRGQFSLESAVAYNPLDGQEEIVLAKDSLLVNMPKRAITSAQIATACQALQTRLAKQGNHWRIRLHFLTPMRLIESQQLLKTPDFGTIFARLLHRVDQLAAQYNAATPRGAEAAQRLQVLANQVRLIAADVEWVDVFSGSRHRPSASPIGGFFGSAEYLAPAEVWHELLEWLVWGQLTQVGKSVVKGDGLYRIESE